MFTLLSLLVLLGLPEPPEPPEPPPLPTAAIQPSLPVYVINADQPEEPPLPPGTIERAAARETARPAEGTWIIVSAETPGWGVVLDPNSVVTIRDNVLSFGGVQGEPTGRAGKSETAPETPPTPARAAPQRMPPRWRLEFGPNNALRAVPSAEADRLPNRERVPEGAKDSGTNDRDLAVTKIAPRGSRALDGVYIRSRDYLCLSLGSRRSFPGGSQAEGAADVPRLVLILRRQGAEKLPTPSTRP